MTKNEYNGWHNYETWVVNMWMDNDQDSQEHWREQAVAAYEEAKDSISANARLTGKEIFTREERAAFSLEKELKNYHEELLPEIEGFAADLLNAAMDEVNWLEIAKHWVESVKGDVETDAARTGTNEHFYHSNDPSVGGIKPPIHRGRRSEY